MKLFPNHWAVLIGNLLKPFPRSAIRLKSYLLELGKMSSDQLRRQRNQKFAAMGRVEAREPVSPFRTDAAPKTEWMQSWEQLSRSTTFAGDVTPG